jgi:hypothetical protein
MHERTDVRLRPILWFGLGLTVATAAIYVVLAWMLVGFSKSAPEVQPPPVGHRRAPPGPSLQLSPAEELKALRENERTLLNEYGWVDRKAGVVRIPIDRAIEILSERVRP